MHVPVISCTEGLATLLSVKIERLVGRWSLSRNFKEIQLEVAPSLPCAAGRKADGGHLANEACGRRPGFEQRFVIKNERSSELRYPVYSFDHLVDHRRDPF